MDDIKRFLLRLPVDLYEKLELQAVELNMSLNRMMVDRLKDSLGVVPVSHRAVDKTRKAAAILPDTIAASDLPTPDKKPCIRCGEKKDVVRWGNGHRCTSCALNF